jgi:hypothetical protein
MEWMRNIISVLPANVLLTVASVGGGICCSRIGRPSGSIYGVVNRSAGLLPMVTTRLAALLSCRLCIKDRVTKCKVSAGGLSAGVDRGTARHYQNDIRLLATYGEGSLSGSRHTLPSRSMVGSGEPATSQEPAPKAVLGRICCTASAYATGRRDLAGWAQCMAAMWCDRVHV